MNTTFPARPILAAGMGLLAIGASFAAGDAGAATYRTTYRTATAVCSGPLPQYDDQLRRSPLGIRNDGTVNVFVSCSLPTDAAGDLTSGLVQVHFHNFGSAQATVNCTLVAGTRTYGFGSVAGSVSVDPGSNFILVWGNIDKHHAFGSNNFSCILPPGVEISTLLNQNNDIDDGL